MSAFTPKKAPATVTITRVRNGFVLTSADYSRMQGMSIEDSYVFNDLEDVKGFLIDNDYELTEE